jgi:hypothetical protein
MTNPVLNKIINQGYVDNAGLYQVTTAFTGASLNDILEKKITVEVATTGINQTTISPVAVYYVNISTGLLLQESEVSSSNIAYIGGGSGGGGSATSANQVLEIAALNSILANQTNNTQSNKITDGTNTGTIKASSTSPLASDTALVNAISPNSPMVGTVAKATAPTNTILSGVVYSSASITLTDQQTVALQCDVNGKLLASIPYSTFGITAYRNTALSNTAQQIKSTSARLYGWNFINTAATSAYIKLFNVASATTGTSAVAKTILVPPTSSIFQSNEIMIQHNFTTAMSIAATLNIADADNTAPASALYAEAFYI